MQVYIFSHLFNFFPVHPSFFPSCHLKLFPSETLILYTKTKLCRASSSIYPTYTRTPTRRNTHFHHQRGGFGGGGWAVRDSLVFQAALALQHASGIQMRIAFVLVAVSILILVFVLFLVSRHHQRYLVAGSRQSTASAIDSQCCNTHTHSQKHTHLHSAQKTTQIHTPTRIGWRAGHKVRLFLVFVFARACLVFRLFVLPDFCVWFCLARIVGELQLYGWLNLNSWI